MRALGFIDIFLPFMDALWHGGPYHSTNHVRDMLHTFVNHYDEITEVYPEFLKEDAVKELVLAVLWHDAEYTAWKNDNELHAATCFVGAMERMPESQRYFLADEKMQERIVDDILSTRYSVTRYDNNVQKVLHDLDWYCFSSQDLLFKAETLILEELQTHGSLNEEEALKARLGFYRDLIESKRQIFVSRWMEGSNKDAEVLIKDRIAAIEGLLAAGKSILSEVIVPDGICEVMVPDENE